MKLTAEDRALIDAHIEKKGVTSCPPHTYTPWDQVRYHDKTRNPLPDARVERRNAKIEELFKAGLTAKAIAEQLNLEVMLVYRRLQWLRYKASLEK